MENKYSKRAAHHRKGSKTNGYCKDCSGFCRLRTDSPFCNTLLKWTNGSHVCDYFVRK